MGLLKEEKVLLKEVYLYARIKKVDLYIVGGYLRDIFLKRQKNNPDIDFALKNGAISFSRGLAKKLGAGFVVLDNERGLCRLVKRMGEKTYTLDFSDFRAKSLKEDLYLRDFTINSTACSLQDYINGKQLNKILLDPYKGIRDLKSKTIRLVNKEAFDHDPLRMLRCFSQAALFYFKIDPQALKMIKAKKDKIKQVSFERIREELFKILSTEKSDQCFDQLDKIGLLEKIFPEINKMRGVNQGPYHHLDILKHSFETLRQLEIILRELKSNKEINTYLDELISSDRTRRSLIKLGAFLHDTGKPAALRREGRKIKFHGHEFLGSKITKAIVQRLKLSNDEAAVLEKIVFCHLRPGYLADSENPSQRAKFRYFRDTAKEAVSVLLVSLADQRATRGRLTTDDSRRQHERVVSNLIKEYFKKQKEKKLLKLINGDELIENFELTPSALIGKILREIEELQAIGKIKTKKEAFIEVKKYLNKRAKK